MLPEARERAALLTDVHTELLLDLTSTEDFGVEATISFGCTQPGASTFLELNGGTDVTLDGHPAAYADGRIPLWWPQALAVGDAAVYIGDRLNRRILAAHLTYKTEATCQVTDPQAKP